MLKARYANNERPYPAYFGFDEDAQGHVRLVVRGPAAHTDTPENGAHYDEGPKMVVGIEKDRLIEAAQDILAHYGIRGSVTTEHTETVGELSVTDKRVEIGTVHTSDDLKLREMFARLSSYLLGKYGVEPSQNRDLVDAVIRILTMTEGLNARLKLDNQRAQEIRRQVAQAVHALEEASAILKPSPVGLIAAGLRAGKAEHIVGETQDSTLTSSFVNAGTDAKPNDPLREFLVERVIENFKADGQGSFSDERESPPPYDGEIVPPPSHDFDTYCGAGDHGFEPHGFDVVSPQPKPDAAAQVRAFGEAIIAAAREPEAAAVAQLDEPMDLPVEQPPYIRDSEFSPAGGRDYGDEDEKPL